MTHRFVPTANAAELSKRAAAALRACADLMALVLPELPPDLQTAIEKVLATGGHVGLELLTNRSAVNTVALVAIENEGARRLIATVATVEAGGPSH